PAPRPQDGAPSAIAARPIGTGRWREGASRTAQNRSPAAAIRKRANCAAANRRGWGRRRWLPADTNEGSPARLPLRRVRSGARRRATETLGRRRGARTPRPPGGLVREVPEGRRPP